MMMIIMMMIIARTPKMNIMKKKKSVMIVRTTLHLMTITSMIVMEVMTTNFDYILVCHVQDIHVIIYNRMFLICYPSVSEMILNIPFILKYSSHNELIHIFRR